MRRSSSTPSPRAYVSGPRRPTLLRVSNDAGIRIIDVTDEASFGLLPPCADPGFDHRSCDYWEDEVRGSKAARAAWWEAAPLPRQPKPRPRSDNPFAPARDEGPAFNPFDPAAGAAEPAFNPFAPVADDDVYVFGFALMNRIIGDYTLRMAGVFMMAIGTLWTRSGIMPRWLAIITYVLALGCLLAAGWAREARFIFPVWVFVISVYILVLNYRYQQENDGVTLEVK